MVLFGCSSDSVNNFSKLDTQYNFYSRSISMVSEPKLPEELKRVGLNVANELRKTIIAMHENNVSFSNSNSSEEFCEYFYKEYAKYSYTLDSIGKGYAFIMDNMMTNAEFLDSYFNITSLQKDYIDKISNTLSKKNSYNEMLNALSELCIEVNNEIPDIQRLRVLKIISVLYYGLSVIAEMESTGMFPLTSKSIHNEFIKLSNTESGITNGSCRSFLAAVWTIAVGELTPLGEIVASVITVVYAGVLMYQVIVCQANDTANWQYCQDKFMNCVSSIPDGCSVCFRYCIQNGVWPPYSTHKCK